MTDLFEENWKRKDFAILYTSSIALIFFYGKKCAKYIPNLAYDITVYDITVYTRSWTMSETCMYCICTYFLNTIIPTSFLKIKITVFSFALQISLLYRYFHR